MFSVSIISALCVDSHSSPLSSFFFLSRRRSPRQIQEILVKLGDKQSAFVGSKNWIGAIELGYILDEYLVSG